MECLIGVPNSEICAVPKNFGSPFPSPRRSFWSMRHPGSSHIHRLSLECAYALIDLTGFTNPDLGSRPMELMLIDIAKSRGLVVRPMA